MEADKLFSKDPGTEGAEAFIEAECRLIARVPMQRGQISGDGRPEVGSRAVAELSRHGVPRGTVGHRPGGSSSLNRLGPTQLSA